MASSEPIRATDMAASDAYPTRTTTPLMADSIGNVRMNMSPTSFSKWRSKVGMRGFARRTLGTACLLLTVFLWTLSNFLASSIFSDSTFDKPFFLVYLDTSVFAISLIPMLIRYLRRYGASGLWSEALYLWDDFRHGKPLSVPGRDHAYEDEDARVGERLLVEDTSPGSEGSTGDPEATTAPAPRKRLSRDAPLTPRETARLSLEFATLWFLANYLASACLQYTSVASSTILNSTSSVWTLVMCALARLEAFTLRKLGGVLASLVGVALISLVDLSGGRDEDRGSFPHKSTGEIALGDAMALSGAVAYGIYITVMKRRVGNEDRVDMQLFFGLVGAFNILFLWPLFFVMHWTGIETFELPPSGQVWAVIIINALASFVSDISWAYAMLLTTPVVVTVGLSLSIPLSFLGEILQYSQYSTWPYWVGAAVVFLSFLFINNESYEDEPPSRTQVEPGNGV